jgi:membrane protein
MAGSERASGGDPEEHAEEQSHRTERSTSASEAGHGSGKHTGREAEGSRSRAAPVSHLDEKRTGRQPEGPAHPRKGGLGQTLKRTVSEFKEDNLSDSAAALTYYGVLSIFPALIALFSLVGLIMSPKKLISAGTDLVNSIGPASAVNTLKGPISSLAASKETAGVLLAVGVAGALWTASGYVGAFMRASNVIYEVEEGRPFVKLRPLQMLVTLLLVLLQAIVLIALVVTGPLATKVGAVIGARGAAVTAWNVAKWPVLLLVVVLMFCVLYYASPNARLSGWKSVVPGALLALAIWLVASVGFAAYVANFGSYNQTYGSLGGVIVFLVWLWITNMAVLLGAEFNAERERSRQITAGTPGAERELQLDERSAPKRHKRSRTA